MALGCRLWDPEPGCQGVLLGVPQLLAGRALLQHLLLLPETGLQEQTSPEAVSSAISLFQVYVIVTAGWSSVSSPQTGGQ